MQGRIHLIGGAGAAGLRADARPGDAVPARAEVQRPHDGGDGFGVAAIGNADDVDRGTCLEELHGEMWQPAIAGMRVVELARIGACGCNELRQRLG